jgi:hypothetical protein
MSGTSMGRDCWGSKAITSMSISYWGSGVSMSISSRCCGITMSSRCSVNGVSTLGDVSVESVVIISSVVDGTGGSISLHKTVVSLHNVTITCLALALLVSGVRVIYTVFKRVFGVCLLLTSRFY